MAVVCMDVGINNQNAETGAEQVDQNGSKSQ